MRTFQSFFITALALSPLLAGCGRGEDVAEKPSETMSLVGLPCEDFGGNFWQPNFHCVTFKAGIVKEVLFDLQGFNATQTQKVKDGLDIAVARYNDYWAGNHGLIQCTIDNASRDFDPKGQIGVTFSGLEKKVTWAITSIQFNYAFHADLHRPAVIKAFNEAPSGTSYTVGQAVVGDDRIKQAASTPYEIGNMDIEVNTVALDAGFSAEVFAGTIIHEWLHRNGWDHPTGYQGSMIKELGLCITRNNGPKGTSLTETMFELND